MAELTLDMLTRFAFLDPASGKQTIKRTRARSAIVVVGVDPLMRVFVLDAWAERASTTRIIEQVFRFNSRYKPKAFGCEANAQQSLFADVVQTSAKHRQIKLPLTPVFQPTKVDKDFRIRSAIQPILSDGRLFVRPDLTELRNELQSFPMSATKDLVDALASAISLVPNRTTRRQRDEEIEQVAAYLRDTGAPMHYIEQRIRELYAEVAL